MAESIRALAPPDFDTILICHAYSCIERGRRRDEGAEDDPRIPRIIRNQRSAVEHCIISFSVINQFDRGADRIDRCSHLILGIRCCPEREIAPQPSASLRTRRGGRQAL